MKRGDKYMACAFALMIAISTAVFAARHFSKREGLVAVIIQDGCETRRISLDNAKPEEFTLTFAEGRSRVRVEKGRIAVISADCPDKDCVRHGWLSRNGDSTVCLPNRLSIRIAGPGKTEVDGAAY